jgi:hypothetical protein
MISRLLSIALVCLPALAFGQATRTWVSGVGDDADTGARTAPCKTFAGAFTKTLPGGIISVLDPGGFGAVTLTNAITIEGEGVEGSVVSPTVNGIIINAGVNDVVTLRNLNIQGAGTGLSGIVVQQAGSVHIENCTIEGCTVAGITFSPANAGCQLYVKDTKIHKCTSACIGIDLKPNGVAAVAHISNSHITNCGTGIEAETNAVAMVDNTVCDSNTNAGYNALGANSNMTLFRCTAAGNAQGVNATGKISISECSIFNNTGNGIKTVGTGKVISFSNNSVSGNNPDSVPTTTAAVK